MLARHRRATLARFGFAHRHTVGPTCWVAVGPITYTQGSTFAHRWANANIEWLGQYVFTIVGSQLCQHLTKVGPILNMHGWAD